MIFVCVFVCACLGFCSARGSVFGKYYAYTLSRTHTHPHDDWDVTQQAHDCASHCAGLNMKLSSGQLHSTTAERRVLCDLLST